jgi:hypothetical protein
MHDSQRFRENAADCLLAARAAREPHYKSLNLLMARAWLSLATHDAAVDDLLATWEAEGNADAATASLIDSELQKKPPASSVALRSRLDEQPQHATDRRSA